MVFPTTWTFHDVVTLLSTSTSQFVPLHGTLDFGSRFPLVSFAEGVAVSNAVEMPAQFHRLSVPVSRPALVYGFVDSFYARCATFGMLTSAVLAPKQAAAESPKSSKRKKTETAVGDPQKLPLLQLRVAVELCRVFITMLQALLGRDLDAERPAHTGKAKRKSGPAPEPELLVLARQCMRGFPTQMLLTLSKAELRKLHKARMAFMAVFTGNTDITYVAGEVDAQSDSLNDSSYDSEQEDMDGEDL
jgi:hypothetical protein